MTFFFALHVLLFSVFAIGLALLPQPTRAACFYAYLSLILFIGGFLGNVYSLTLFNGIEVSGGNLAYGAFMMTSIVFVLAERDSFVLRRIIYLVVAANTFIVLLSLVITGTLEQPGITNVHGTPSALFQTSIHLIIVGGVLIVVELAFMLWLFELLKRVTRSIHVASLAYVATFVAVLCFDGFAFLTIAFGFSYQTLQIAAGSFAGKLVTAVSYSLALLAFFQFFPSRFSAYLGEHVFSWRTVLSTSGEIMRDLDEKDAQLQKTRSRIVHSAELAGLGYAVIDVATGQTIECDAAYAAMHGSTVSDCTATSDRCGIIVEPVHEDDLESSREVAMRIANRQAGICELRHRVEGGQYRALRKVYSPLDATPGNTRYEVVCQDVTDSRTMQENLFQSQKLDAIGRLTGGVAHDFNNLLMVVMGNLELLNDTVRDPVRRGQVQKCIDATTSATELTQNLLSFARRAPLKPAAVNLNELVRNIEEWIGRTLPSAIAVEIRLADELWSTRVDPSSAESAILNLILNARDSMPDGGTLTVETANVTIDRDVIDSHHRTVPQGHYVSLTVKDSGEGIAKDNIRHIFEPFYTTKPVGDGTGLGLAMLDGFVRQSNGWIHVDFEVGHGSSFSLYFGATDAPGIDKGSATGQTIPNFALRRPTILLVEDNEAVAEVIRSMLVHSGCRVTAVASGDEALRSVGRNSPIDLLITDIVMPGQVQGTALASQLRERYPDLPVIYLTGYANLPDTDGRDASADDIRLTKPVRREQLLNAVQQALDHVDVEESLQSAG